MVDSNGIYEFENVQIFCKLLYMGCILTKREVKIYILLTKRESRTRSSLHSRRIFWQASAEYSDQVVVAAILDWKLKIEEAWSE